MSIFKVTDLKRIADEMHHEGIEYVEIEMYERDEIEGELIGATIEFIGFNEDREEVDFGGIEEVVDEI